jgi:hypothetical protein
VDPDLAANQKDQRLVAFGEVSNRDRSWNIVAGSSTAATSRRSGTAMPLLTSPICVLDEAHHPAVR